MLNEPRVAFKEPGTYGDFNTDAHIADGLARLGQW